MKKYGTPSSNISHYPTRENKLVISRCAHYVLAVMVVEDYTSITRRAQFKPSVSPAFSRTLSLSLARSTSQPFVGYSMVLQSVTRAVTWPVGHRLRKGLFRKADYARTSLFLSFHFSVFTLSVVSLLDTDELDVVDRVIDGVKPIMRLSSMIASSLSLMTTFARHCLRVTLSIKKTRASKG